MIPIKYGILVEGIVLRLVFFLIFFYFYFFSFCFLGPYLWHMEITRLGVRLELQLPAFTTAIATPDLSHICDLHYSSQQC